MTASHRAALQSLGALVLGGTLGILVSSPGAKEPALVGWVEPVGLLWVNAIRMTVIPLIVASLVVAVSDTSARAMGRLGTRSFVVFLLLLAVIAALTALAAPPVFALLTIDASAAAAVRGGVDAATTLPTMPSFTSWLVGIVPANPIKAAVDGAMLSLVVATLAFGLALGRVEAARRESVVGFFRGVAEAMTVIVGWILAAAPYGVFALAFTVAARLGTAIVGAVGFYIVSYAAMLLVATLLVYVAIALFARVPLALFARAALPAQLVAVTTRSSMAALPVMVTSAEETLHLPRAVTSFAIPLAVSTFRLNQAVSWVVMALFAAKLYGVELGMAAVLTLAVTSVLMSFSVPGIPSASLFVVAPFFASVGIPPEAIGVLIALDLIPDVFKTLLNVTGQLGAVTLISARVEPES
ncbi:MAG: dicarboxylate/amino acid:cation symporter [Gemmatimonadaceae bacterium]